MKIIKEFDLTEDHIFLLRHAYVDWDDCETGAPAINCKRPYGNSSVAEDILEMLGESWGEKPVKDDDDYDEWTEDQKTRALKVHHETQYALQIILCTGKFEPGTYRKSRHYDNHSWELVK